jgi:hypothetical protein
LKPYIGDVRVEVGFTPASTLGFGALADPNTWLFTKHPTNMRLIFALVLNEFQRTEKLNLKGDRPPS